ncbi:MAG: Trm112 family protein [Candidatus Thermoplasmatota archaeon]|jgi:uncharacterized protein YbaR (Trm112 family)|nr:Trm112 family protein [Candidatus Thermoplasmatota archaeon]MCL5963377.1 Trm112 family protein [Candidatus Thermoplasmatota archaeon]
MYRDLLKILCCSSCKGELKLEIEKEENDEIISGYLTCKNCGLKYPIEDGIPVMIIPQK